MKVNNFLLKKVNLLLNCIYNWKKWTNFDIRKSRYLRRNILGVSLVPRRQNFLSHPAVAVHPAVCNGTSAVFIAWMCHYRVQMYCCRQLDGLLQTARWVATDCWMIIKLKRPSLRKNQNQEKKQRKSKNLEQDHQNELGATFMTRFLTNSHADNLTPKPVSLSPESDLFFGLLTQ